MRGNVGVATASDPLKFFPHLFALVPFLLALAYWRVHPQIGIDADTPRYLAGSAMRTATYPLFLRLANGPALLPIQLSLFAASLAWLALYSAKCLPLIWAVLLVFAIGANPYVWELQATIMSEALTTPLLTLFVGCILGFAVAGRRAPLFASALICGFATSIRPSLLFLILGSLIVVWFGRKVRDRIQLSIIVVVLCLTPVAAERVYSKWVHGSELHSPLGLLLFMKASVIDAPPMNLDTNDPLKLRLVEFINKDYAPVRDLIRNTRDRNVRYILLTGYEGCAAYTCREGVFHKLSIGELESYRSMGEVGLERIRSNPTEYLKLALSEYNRMFLLHPRKQPDLAFRYNEFLYDNSPLPFQAELREEGQPTPAKEQKQIYRFNRAVFSTIGLTGISMLIGFALWSRGALTNAAFGLLLGTEAALFFTAFVALGLPRYAMGLWPTLIGGIVIGIGGLWMLPQPLDDRINGLTRIG